MIYLEMLEKSKKKEKVRDLYDKQPRIVKKAIREAYCEKFGYSPDGFYNRIRKRAFSDIERNWLTNFINDIK